MKIGAMVPLGGKNVSASYVRTLGPALEERGFESLWLAEHNVLFDHDSYESRYPYTEDGRFPGPSDGALLEPLTALSFLAGVTTTLRLGTGILVVPQRNPVFTAKQVSDVDLLSGGRVEFGIGIGWLREEFAALGASFEHRGGRTNDYLRVMQSCWTDEVSSYQGKYYELAPCRFNPKPVQKPHPPIHVGGETDAALRRVAEFGRGWYSLNPDPAAVPGALARLEPMLAERGRSLADVSVSVCPGLRDLDKEKLARFRDAGVDRVIVEVVAKDRDRLLSKLDRVAADVVDVATAL
ncbi:LLM class F420-dependent oxidoreductase [Amycolatopsis sp. K13G38]|uniref:LLM class F420-dependent oxidoreductase n=1 Tax=Amycolatopsis acididurans TaxID=2724524 RepID=A0ABX1JIH9_9PSEU|nr:LLM class F420-dependent oxidoreductase [Amycolatopsis acididurans]NKQ58042.1 LLM class F420-dependent oxidoreductase [Amycolatopsis acididurans]